jgi:hypothetical protein
VLEDVSPDGLSEAACFAGSFENSYTTTQNQALMHFLKSGGGVIMAENAWDWVQSHADVGHQFPGNKIAPTTGLYVSPKNTQAGIDFGSSPPSRLLRAGAAVKALNAHLLNQVLLTPSEQLIVATALEGSLIYIPFDYDVFWGPLRTLVETRGWTRITSGAPFDLRNRADALYLRIQGKLLNNLAASELPVYPGVAEFPGEVPVSAGRVRRVVEVDGDFEGLPQQFNAGGARADGWRSTGLYAAPGEVVTLTFPARVLGHRVKVLIGAHTDTLWEKDTIKRFPVITRSWSVDATVIDAGNAWGGLIYIRVPAGASLGRFDVIISNAVEAPWYRHGVTSLREWKNTVRNHPAPWAELQSSLYTLTLPSSEIRDLQNPDAVMHFWDRVLSVEHEFSGFLPWPRAERAVFDLQISAGEQHSGYPFMAHLHTGPLAVDVAHLNREGDWGNFHELGHNHQWRETVLPGTREATVNLWSVKVMADVVGLTLDEMRGNLSDSERRKVRRAYFDAGADIKDWSVWTALETYLQVQEAFGWEPFTQAFRAYYTMSDPPRGDEEMFNRWVIEISKATGRDLSDFHQAWGLPVTNATHAALRHLPGWDFDPRD